MSCEFIPQLADPTACKSCGQSYFVHGLDQQPPRVTPKRRKRVASQKRAPPEVEAEFIRWYTGLVTFDQKCAELGIHRLTGIRILKRNAIPCRMRPSRIRSEGVR